MHLLRCESPIKGWQKSLRHLQWLLWAMNLLSFVYAKRRGRVKLLNFLPAVLSSAGLKCEDRMASPGIAPISIVLEGFSGTGSAATPALLGAMLRASEKVSDLIFSPGRPPQVQVYGQLIPIQVPGMTVLSPDDTRHIAVDLLGDNKQAITTLREHGACDVSYGLPRLPDR